MNPPLPEPFDLPPGTVLETDEEIRRVQAEIRGRKVENIVRLPRSAMRDNNQVLVVDSDNRLHFRQVQILRLEHDDMLISDGLSDGELVSISPMQTVVEGMLVKPVRE